jgi:hypothetical protein
MTMMTLVTAICGGFLTPVLIRSGVGYLRVEGKGEGARRADVKLICGSDLEPTPLGVGRASG